MREAVILIVVRCRNGHARTGNISVRDIGASRIGIGAIKRDSRAHPSMPGYMRIFMENNDRLPITPVSMTRQPRSDERPVGLTLPSFLQPSLTLARRPGPASDPPCDQKVTRKSSSRWRACSSASRDKRTSARAPPRRLRPSRSRQCSSDRGRPRRCREFRRPSRVQS